MTSTPTPLSPSSSCLVVDDEVDIADVLAYHLTRCGFSTTVATSLHDARDRLTDQDWDLVVIDVMLPDGDGRDLIRAVRDLAHRTKVVLTSVLSHDDLRGHDADSFLAQPFRRADVNRALATARVGAAA